MSWIITHCTDPSRMKNIATEQCNLYNKFNLPTVLYNHNWLHFFITSSFVSSTFFTDNKSASLLKYYLYLLFSICRNTKKCASELIHDFSSTSDIQPVCYVISKHFSNSQSLCININYGHMIRRKAFWLMALKFM